MLLDDCDSEGLRVHFLHRNHMPRVDWFAWRRWCRICAAGVRSSNTLAYSVQTNQHDSEMGAKKGFNCSWTFALNSLLFCVCVATRKLRYRFNGFG